MMTIEVGNELKRMEIRHNKVTRMTKRKLISNCRVYQKNGNEIHHPLSRSDELDKVYTMGLLMRFGDRNTDELDFFRNTDNTVMSSNIVQTKKEDDNDDEMVVEKENRKNKKNKNEEKVIKSENNVVVEKKTKKIVMKNTRPWREYGSRTCGRGEMSSSGGRKNPKSWRKVIRQRDFGEKIVPRLSVGSCGGVNENGVLDQSPRNHQCSSDSSNFFMTSNVLTVSTLAFIPKEQRTKVLSVLFD